MQKSLLLLSFLLALSSCGKKAGTTPAKKDPPAASGKKKADPKPPQTGAPDYDARARLEKLIETGEEMEKDFDGKKLFAKSGLKMGDGCLQKGEVFVHKLKSPKGKLQGVIFHVWPDSFKPCEKPDSDKVKDEPEGDSDKDAKEEEEPFPPNFCTVTIANKDGKEVLVGRNFMPSSATYKKLLVEVVPGKWGIDIISIEYDNANGAMAQCKKNDDDSPEEIERGVNILSLMNGKVTEVDSITLVSDTHTPGDVDSHAARARWYFLLTGAVKTPVLVVTKYDVRHPNNTHMENDPDAEPNPVTCSTKALFYRLDLKGTKLTMVSSKADLDTLRKNPTLAKIPLTQSAEGEEKCKSLEP